MLREAKSSVLLKPFFNFLYYGSTRFNITILVSLIILAYFLIVKFKYTVQSLKKIGFFLYFYICLIFLSYFNSLFYISGFSDFIIVVKGTIMFFLRTFLTILIIILLQNKHKYFFKGLLIGLFINFFISTLVLFIYYTTGTVITLYDLAEQGQFYQPNYTIRVQGLFLEPTSYTITMFFLLFYYYKKPIYRIAISTMSLIIFIFSGSGLISVFALTFLFIIIINIKPLIHFLKNYKHKKLLFVFLAIILFVFLLTILIILFIPSINSIVNEAINSLNPFNAGNEDRLVHMSAALQIALTHPLGVGFNLTGLMMKQIFPDLDISTPHNLFLNNYINLGLIGFLTYCSLFFVPIAKLYKKDKNTIFLCGALLSVALAQLIGGDEFEFAYISLGLSYCLLSEKKETYFYEINLDNNKEKPVKRLLSILANYNIWF